MATERERYIGAGQEGIVLKEENLEEIHRRLKGTSGERTMGQLQSRLKMDQRMGVWLKKPDYFTMVWVDKEVTPESETIPPSG